ncbi:MAG: flagellin [bacterium]
MRIVHNPEAINSHRNLSATNRALARNLERMSSGLRINRAADDAAGLAIAQRVDTQVLGLEQGIRNTLDGISVIQTAEAGMSAIQDMLQRMRVLAIESANGSETPDQRLMIQAEVNQLLESINSQAEAVEFNAMKLLTGNFSEDAPMMYNAARTSGEQARDDSGVIDLYAKFSAAGFEGTDGVTQLTGQIDSGSNSVGGYVKVNGAVFSLSDYDSVNDFMQAINESQQANATITYDVQLDRFTITSDTPETPLRLAQSAGTGNTPFFTAARIDVGTIAPPGPRAMAITQYEANNQNGNAVGTQDIEIIDLTKSFNRSQENDHYAGFDSVVDGTIAINGVRFSVADYATVEEFMRAINTSAEADVTISYDRDHDEFMIVRDTEGKDLVLSAVSGTNNFLYEVSILDREGENEHGGGGRRASDGAEVNTNTGTVNDAKMNNSNIFKAPVWYAYAESRYDVRQDDEETVNPGQGDPSGPIEAVSEVRSRDKVNLNYGVEVVGDSVTKLGAVFNSAYSRAWQGRGDAMNREAAEYDDGGGNMNVAAIQTGYASPDDHRANFDRDVTGTITINNATFSIAKYNTVNELLTAINANEDANVTVGYDTIQDKFWIRSDDGSEMFIAEHKSTAGFGFFEEVGIKAGLDGMWYKPDGYANPEWRKEGLLFHVGANDNETLKTNISTINTKSLKIDVLEDNGVTTTFASESAIRLLLDAIDAVSMERANLGAIQNRMEHRLSFSEIAHENQTASLSRIRDLDFAEESIVFVKNQILLQSSTAMLAQANALPQNVLALIG